MEDQVAKESSSQEDASSINGISSDVEQIEISASEEENREPEALDSQVQVNGENDEEMTNDVVPSTGEANGLAQTQDSQQNDDDPQIPLADFDWAEFEDRYRIAMESANGKQDALLNEFENLIKYYGIWAEASARYDDDRSLKRLKTRESYVQRAEGSFNQKKEHHSQVVAAFQSALALLQGM